MLHSLHVVWIHALCMQCSPHSRVANTKTSCNSSCTRTWTALYHLNNAFLFIDAFINITFGCNANAGKCTGISQCLVNSSKHSSGWYSTVQKTSLIFSYGMNWITVTKTIHINHICILCNWKCKWHRERNRRTEMRISTELTGTIHCRFYCPRLYETIVVLFWTSGAGSHCNVSDMGFCTRSSSSWVMQYTVHRPGEYPPTLPSPHSLNAFQVSR